MSDDVYYDPRTVDIPELPSNVVWRPAPDHFCNRCVSVDTGSVRLEDRYESNGYALVGPHERRCPSCKALYSLHD